MMKDDNIIIKPADKGSGLVIWDKEHYLRECPNQLDDGKVYKKKWKRSKYQSKQKYISSLKKYAQGGEIDQTFLKYWYINIHML